MLILSMKLGLGPEGNTYLFRRLGGGTCVYLGRVRVVEVNKSAAAGTARVGFAFDDDVLIYRHRSLAGPGFVFPGGVLVNPAAFEADSGIRLSGSNTCNTAPLDAPGPPL